MFLLAFILLVVSGTFFWAGKNVNGNHWADRICSEGPSLCGNQSTLLALAAIAIFVGLILQIAKKSR